MSYCVRVWARRSRDDSWHVGWRAYHLDGKVRNRREAREFSSIVIRTTAYPRPDGNDCAKVTGTEAPQVKISDLVDIALNRLPETFRHASIRVHVDEDGAGVANETESPTGNNQGSDDASQRVHPHPADRTS